MIGEPEIPMPEPEVPASEGAAPQREPEEGTAPAGFAFPEGFEVDEAAVADFGAWAERAGVGEAPAQELVDLYVRTRQQEAESQRQAQVAQLQDWERQVKTDRELGGADLERKLAVARAPLERFADPELRDLLDATGLGSHPGVVRLFYRLGQALGGERFIPPGEGAGPTTPEARARRLYDKTYKE